ncbi:hypothetical protein [Mucilaginibacter sp.]|uniref:hypothetical protein n=1 Tax=Mucilaginibacter sp. TaxID=1882438 RepID=UPI002632C12F|nr:hypothetical protein [Mucilaginibacter sp.]MDB5030719.1 hypothetical protein [Mucilaginibacter sp.]
MKNKTQRYARLILSVAVFTIISIKTIAQKLPNVQDVSLRAPADIKIDGKIAEWDNKFQAYNKATDIFYTIANDNDKLYLTIQATDPSIITKIISGGVTFSISASGDKKAKNLLSITFPAKEGKVNPLLIKLINKPKPSNDAAKYKMQLDSFMKVINKRLTDSVKLIGVTNLKDIEDNFISMYNDLGIKAAALFDNNISYNYELAIPKKYLGLGANNLKFTYQIKLNGTTPPNATIQQSGSGRFLIVTVGNNPPYAIPNVVPYAASAYPTDFWGEYTLAKK